MLKSRPCCRRGRVRGAEACPGWQRHTGAARHVQKNPNTLRWNPAAGEGAFAVPGMPWVAAASVLLNVFLLGSVKAASWRLFAAWVAATLAFYLAYSMPASYAHHALERCAHPCPARFTPAVSRRPQHARPARAPHARGSRSR